ncbi:MAG TPA: FAD binding domain-containing protein [Anaerolineaceae bacterium]|nr:FAD binding domain-containing protein [Anaerolineaceae bacterium]
MWNKYILAASLPDALMFLDQDPDASKVVSGGTDLILEIKRGQRKEKTKIIDISRISDLNTITRDENGDIHIGALVTHNQVASSSIIRSQARCLAEAAFQVGSPQIRNRGTIAGNLITASPANDTIPALIALDAELVLASSDGDRRVFLESFYTGVRKTVIKNNEILKEIVIKAKFSEYISTFYKFALRNAQAISVVNAAIALKISNSQVVDVVIAVGAVAPTVVRLRGLENQVTGLSIHQLENFSLPDDFKEISPISDIRGSELFRREMVRVIIMRCFESLLYPERSNNLVPEDPVTLSNKLNNNGRPELLQSEIIDDDNPIRTTINGKNYVFTAAYQKTLLDLIREDASLIGSKEGCAEGECGACTVHLDGEAVMSCLVPAPRAHLAEITTIEGISDDDTLHPVQYAFVEEGAVQCGYCTPGFIMSAVKLLEQKPHPGESEIKEALTGNLCRCTGYYKIIRAIEKAASEGGILGQA